MAIRRSSWSPWTKVVRGKGRHQKEIDSSSNVYKGISFSAKAIVCASTFKMNIHLTTFFVLVASQFGAAQGIVLIVEFSWTVTKISW